MKRLNDILAQWQSELNVASVSELFIRVIYLTLIWSTIKLLFAGDLVWGSDWVHILYNPYEGIDKMAMLLNLESVREHYLWFAVPFLGLLIAGLFGWHNVITRAVVWYLFVVLHFGNVEISSGGHHLYQQMLFFHIVLFKVEEDDESKWASARRLLHHLGHYSIWVQIALLYFISGIWKLRGDLWLGGEAMLMSLSFPQFSLPWIMDSLKENTWYLALGTWMVLAYQLLFAFLIWIRPVRKPLLAFGLIFHLSIVFIVGLADFGLFMIASYSIFLSASDARRVMDRLFVMRLMFRKRVME